MKKDDIDYINIKSNLQSALRNILSSNETNKDIITQNTRFEIKNKANADEVIRKIDMKWKEDYYLLRKKWSYYIFASLAWTILFQFFLTWFLIYWVMHSVFPFKDVYNLFFLIVWENFAQIIWLSYIIVRFLFSYDSNKL